MLIDPLRDWKPFRLDALGLVTILGYYEIQLAIGCLVSSSVTEWLPFLGAFTVASNQIAQPIPGFVLYNISDGIMTTDIASWFARWLLVHPLKRTSTKLTLEMNQKPQAWIREAVAMSVGTVIALGMIALAICMGDWWGFANAIAMTTSVLVRKGIVVQNRSAIDKAVSNSITDTKTRAIQDEQVKIFITTPSHKAVSVYADRMVVINVLVNNNFSRRPTFVRVLRAIGWASYAVHIISLGMACLFNQIISVVVLCTSTMLAVYGIGDSATLIGTKLKINVSTAMSQDHRPAAYAALALTEKEEDSMVQWSLMPHRTNLRWWGNFREAVTKWKQFKEQDMAGDGAEKAASVSVSVSKPELVSSSYEVPLSSSALQRPPSIVGSEDERSKTTAVPTASPQ